MNVWKYYSSLRRPFLPLVSSCLSQSHTPLKWNQSIIHNLVTNSKMSTPNTVIQSPSDKRIYKSLLLANNMKVLLVSDHDKKLNSEASEKLAAASLCINIGSLCDPKDVPGLSHFLEHMVFMGSEKYPDENDFDGFIRLHGGSNNAFTDYEKTCFYFDIKREKFRDALDRFSGFFTCPLMKRDSVDRETEAVDSEFEMALVGDTNCKEQLLASLAKEGNPMGVFAWGNRETLSNKDIIYNELISYHKRYYSSHYMSLALQSHDTIETLEEYATSIFSNVPNNGLPKPDLSSHLDPFDGPKWHKLYNAIPVKNVHQLVVNWALPPLQAQYRMKPLGYLGWLIGHEGTGSILSFLKQRLLALTLCGGNNEGGFQFNQIWSQFSICVNLTEKGIAEVEQVILAIFQYIKMLQKNGPSEEIFKEIQQIELNSFNFQEECDPSDYAVELTESMHAYPVAEYLTGSCLYHDYDPALISDCLGQLRPDNCSILLYTKQATNCNETERWFKTAYRVEEVPKKWKESWIECIVPAEMHLPKPNGFLSTKFDLIPEKPEMPKYPSLILESPGSRLWYKQDDSFKIPKTIVYYLLRCNLASSSPMSAVMFDLFVRLVQENLREPGYPANMAKYDYRLSASSFGLEIYVEGFSEKLKSVFVLIVEKITQFSASEDLFNAIVEELIKTYENSCIKAKKLNTDIRLCLLEENYWSSAEKRLYISSISYEMFLGFVKQFLAFNNADGLIQGNCLEHEALSFEKILSNALKSQCLPPHLVRPKRVIELPKKFFICRVKNMNTIDKNSVICNYIQFGPATLEELTITELLVMRMQEPVFDQLRTNQSLGYSVYARMHNTCGVMGLSITVESQASKFSMEELNKRISAFMLEFKTMLEKMTDAEFETIVHSLIKLLLAELPSLSDEASRNWNEILDSHFLFDRPERKVEFLRRCKKADLLGWYTNFVVADVRRLSMQVVGVGSPAGEESHDENESDFGSDEESDDEEGKCLSDLEYILPEDESAIKIMNLHKFKSSQHYFPVSNGILCQGAGEA